MKKEAIIDIIENDLNEIKTLLETFRGADKIPSAFLELLTSKHVSLGKELLLLDFWKETSTTTNILSDIPTTPNETSTNAPQETTETIEDSDYNTNLDFCDKMTSPNNEEIISVTPTDTDNTNVSPTESIPVANAEEKPEVQDVSVQKEEVKVNQEPEKPQIPSVKEPAQPKAVSTPSEKRTPSVADITNFGLPVDDIRKAISIADRFLYQRELFGNNNETMNNTLEVINGMSSYDDAYLYIKSSFCWDETDPTVENFLKTVHRRFL